MKTENEKFLKELFEKTVIWRHGKLRPNMGGHTIHTRWADFSKFTFSPELFGQLLEVIKTERLLVLPEESVMGWIEGYRVCDYNLLTHEMELVMLFGGEQLPQGHTLKELFSSLCHSQQNRELLSCYVPKEGYVDEREVLENEFEDYSY